MFLHRSSATEKTYQAEHSVSHDSPFKGGMEFIIGCHSLNGERGTGESKTTVGKVLNKCGDYTALLPRV